VAERPALRACGLMLASGFAGLGYQIVWTQQAALWMGHEAAAVLAVITAFFGGLALGSGLLGTRIEASARPERWYAACEGLIALWGAALALLLAPVSNLVIDLSGLQATPLRQGLLTFGATFVLLLPATLAMGATLPALAGVLERSGGASRVAALYACNTAGAFLGVLATAFWMVPVLGLQRSALVCVGLNLLCAGLAGTLRAGHAASPASAVVVPGAARPGLATLRTVQAVLGATGLLGIGYEVLVVRVLSQVTEATVYTYTLLLAVYLVGTALGAAAWQRWIDRRGIGQLDGAVRALLRAQAVTCVLGSLSLYAAQDLHQAAQQALGAGMAGALAAEGLLALVAFLPPTLLMGALFSALCQQAGQRGVGFGRALAVNTLGAALAPLLFGLVLAPALGPKGGLLIVAGGYLLLGGLRQPTLPATVVGAAVLAGLAVWAPPLAFVERPEDGRVVRYIEGRSAAVSVVEDGEGVLRLRINNRQQEGSSATRLADARQALLPLLLHPDPHRALFLGLGTGITAASAAATPGLQVDAVELLPEVIEASALFTRAFQGGQPLAQLHIVEADARRAVRSAGPGYDLIVADNFHPARSGSGALYTVEHFRAVRQRLAPGGLFCQWLPLHQLDLETLRTVARAFVEAYPQAWVILATNSLETPVLGLVARQDGQRFDAARLVAHQAALALPLALAEHGLGEPLDLLGSFVAGPSSLQRWVQGAELNTDDRPVVSYTAPRITYAPDSLPRDRLLGWLAAVGVQPVEVLDDPDALPGLAAYWQARNRFLAVGRDVRPAPDVGAMLAQVREPLLDVLRLSADFRPAYDPLLRMAGVQARSDAPAARRLLQQLQTLQPARPEAAALLREFGSDRP
jgi:spermidine synthase